MARRLADEISCCCRAEIVWAFYCLAKTESSGMKVRDPARDVTSRLLDMIVEPSIRVVD